MRGYFRKQLQEVTSFRKQADLPNVGIVIVSVIILTLIYIALSIIFFPANRNPAFNFYSEAGSITALSAIFLTMASSFSVGVAVVHIRAKNLPVWPWVIIALAFAALALDELLGFHEFIDRVMRRDLDLDSGIFRNWNDVVVLIYGVVALPIVAVLLPSILRYRKLAELFVVAFVFYVIHTFIDSTQEPATLLSVILEESSKVMCGAFLALGMLIGFLGALWNCDVSNKPK